MLIDVGRQSSESSLPIYDISDKMNTSIIYKISNLATKGFERLF